MKRLKLFAILIIISVPAFSQQEESLDEMIDEFLFGKSVQDSLIGSILTNEIDIIDIVDALYNNSFLYIRSDFENRTFFSGQDLGIDQFNIASQIYYQGSEGLSLGIAGIMYSKFEPRYNTTIFTAGYNNRIRTIKRLNIRALYSRYLFAKIDTVPDNAFNSAANLGATWRFGVFGTSADLSLLMGDEFSGQATFNLFAEIQVIKLGLFNRITFEPEIALLFGNETIVVNQYVNLPRFTGEIYSEKNSFGLMNLTLRIPISISLGNFDLSAGYNFNIPRSPGTDTNPSATSYLNLSVGYVFNL